ncbi:MAG: histidinol-phosphate aminotransferase family protein [Bacteroidia bacterium]|jgi:histidinol-phosphate/aromatic aminotransferase/cobyric acid decarboxylase-like protein|nr:histidinol-phosphate aminotransferase family protein [Bacteroidia bacterium]
MAIFTPSEQVLAAQILKLKQEAGSHSPSIFTFKQKLPQLDIKVDACFLSNPYATELFLEYFNHEIVETGKIRDLLEWYPSQNAVIAEILADFLKLKPEHIFIGNGAIEIIQAIVHNFTEKKILINIPTFSSYYEYAKEGVEVVYNQLLKEHDYAIDIEGYISRVKEEQPDTIVLINPNNPNGAYLTTDELRHIVTELHFVKNIIIDESFIHFAYEDKAFRLISTGNWVEEFPNLIVLKSMSKDFGIAGVRAGYGIMQKEKVSTLLKTGYLWNSNGLAEYFFRLYTRADFAYNYEKVRVKYILETMEFIADLKTIPNIRVYPSKANFVLVEIIGGRSSAEIVSLLLIKYGIYVRTCEDKIGLQGDYIRLASRSKAENDYILQSFRDVFQ